MPLFSLHNFIGKCSHWSLRQPPRFKDVCAKIVHSIDFFILLCLLRPDDELLVSGTPKELLHREQHNYLLDSKWWFYHMAGWVDDGNRCKPKRRAVGFTLVYYRSRNDVPSRKNRSCSKRDEEIWHPCTGNQWVQMGWFWADAAKKGETVLYPERDDDIHLNQEIIKVREWIPHKGPLAKAIRLKPSSFADITRGYYSRILLTDITGCFRGGSVYVSFRFVLKQSKASNSVKMSSLIFWLQAKELRLSVCCNTFRNFNWSLNKRRMYPAQTITIEWTAEKCLDKWQTTNKPPNTS